MTTRGVTHHFRTIQEETGFLIGALSDLQAQRARELIEAAGQKFDYRSFPITGHSMHRENPKLFADTRAEWADTLPPA